MPLKMKSLKLIKLSLLVMVGGGDCIAAKAQPQIVDGVVAVVGNNIVLKTDIDQQFENLKKQGLTENEAEKCRIFEELLFEKLLLHQAELDSIEVSEGEVGLAIQRRMDVFIQQIGSQQRLEQYYQKSVIEIKEEMKPLVRNQLIAQKMLREITSKIKITPSEVRVFYRQFPKDGLPLVDAQVEYAQIVKYADVSKSAKQEAINHLKDIKRRIQEGSSFSIMAVLYSEDPGSAKNGGEYKGIKRGQFVKDFEAVAFNLKENEMSDPFQTEYGYHIVQLQKRKGEELDMRHILIKPKILPENLQEAERFLDSIRDMILEKKMDFSEAAGKFSQDENSKLNGGLVINPQTGESRWKTRELNKNIFYTLGQLQKGNISEPVFFRTAEGKEGYRLLKLMNKSEPHRANLQTDYQLLQNVALQEKQNKATEKWISEKLRKTYVRVNNDYFNCNFKSNWIMQSSQYVE